MEGEIRQNTECSPCNLPLIWVKILKNSHSAIQISAIEISLFKVGAGKVGLRHICIA